MRFGRPRRSDMLSCREVGRVLQSYLDGEVDDLRTHEVAHHLEACRRCGMAAETYAEIKRSLRRCGASAPEEAVDRLRVFCQQLSRGGLPTEEEPAGA